MVGVEPSCQVRGEQQTTVPVDSAAFVATIFLPYVTAFWSAPNTAKLPTYQTTFSATLASASAVSNISTYCFAEYITDFTAICAAISRTVAPACFKAHKTTYFTAH